MIEVEVSSAYSKLSLLFGTPLSHSPETRVPTLLLSENCTQEGSYGYLNGMSAVTEERAG